MQCIELYKTKIHTSVEGLTENFTECVWKRTPPSPIVFIIYSFVIPIFACFGICANFINAIVFMRPKMTPSAFIYLASLSWLDCFSCVLILLTSFSRSVLYLNPCWLKYDFQWQPPLFGITTGAANLTLACVSLDRLIYLWYGVPAGHGTPRFCQRKVAKRTTIIVILISIIVNLPYFFIFIVHEDGSFETTQFYYSCYYTMLNWFTFLLLGVLPAILLLIGNIAIIFAFRRWTEQSKKCQTNNKIKTNLTEKRYKHQLKLTITIFIVISLYIVGELPAHFTSRKSVVNLVYGGNIEKIDFQIMEKLELVFLTLNVLQLSINILVYAIINPSFLPEFFKCLQSISDFCLMILSPSVIANYFRRLFRTIAKTTYNFGAYKRKENDSYGDLHNVDKTPQINFGFELTEENS